MATDDKYGLEPAGGTGTAILDDKYGLEAATPAAAAPTGPTQLEKAQAEQRRGPKQEPQQEREAREFNLGVMSGMSGEPETKHPLRDLWTGVKKSYAEDLPANLATGGLYGIGKAGIGLGQNLYQTGKGMLFPEGRTEQEQAEARAHAVGQGVGQLVPIALGEGVGEAGKAVESAGGLKKIALKPLEAYHVGLTGEELLKKGVSPRAQATGWDDAIARPGVQRALKSVPIKSAADLDEAIPGMKDQIWQDKVEPALERQKDRPLTNPTTGVHDMQPAAEAVRKVITPEIEEFEPEKAKELGDLADKLGRSRTVGEANRLLSYVNGKLESYFNKYPSARRADLMKNPDTAGWESARRAIREQFLGTLENAGEEQIREARQDYGGLETVAKEVERRVNVADRQKPMSLGRILGMVGAVPTGGVSVVAGELAHHLNKPDVLIRRGIGRLNPPAEGAFTAPAAYQDRAQFATAQGPTIPQHLEPIGPAERAAPQFAEPQGPTIPQHLEPIGPQPGPQAPPPVQTQFRLERIGQEQPQPIGNENVLGPTGQGGVRIPPGGRALPAPQARWTNPEQAPAPPTLSAIAKPTATPLESIGNLGRPTAAPQTRPVAETYAPQELEEAKLLVQQELGMMRSGERPGRYFNENPNAPGEYLTPQREQNAGQGKLAGGRWMGVKSMRTMLPWFSQVSFSPGEVERALRAGEGPVYEQVMRSAADFVKREAEGEAGEREAIAGEQGGAEEEPSFLPAEEQAPAAAPAFKGGINPKGVEQSLRPSNPQEQISALNQHTQDMKEQLRSGRGSPEERQQAEQRIAENEGLVRELRGEGKDIKFTTDQNGTRWAESSEGYKVSIPRRIPEEEAEAYARPKLEEQARIHRDIKNQ